MPQTTITVQEETLERFNNRKETASEVADVPEPNSDEFLEMLLNVWDEHDPTTEVESNTDEIVEQLKNELSMVAEPGVVFEDEDVKRLFGRIDDLESSIPNKTADELMGRINR